MKFEKAVRLLKDGKKIKRPDFDKDEYITLNGGTIPRYFNNNIDGWDYFHFDYIDFLANDWEEYTEE